LPPQKVIQADFPGANPPLQCPSDLDSPPVVFTSVSVERFSPDSRSLTVTVFGQSQQTLPGYDSVHNAIFRLDLFSPTSPTAVSGSTTLSQACDIFPICPFPANTHFNFTRTITLPPFAPLVDVFTRVIYLSEDTSTILGCSPLPGLSQAQESSIFPALRYGPIALTILAALVTFLPGILSYPTSPPSAPYPNPPWPSSPRPLAWLIQLSSGSLTTRALPGPWVIWGWAAFLASTGMLSIPVPGWYTVLTSRSSWSVFDWYVYRGIGMGLSGTPPPVSLRLTGLSAWAWTVGADPTELIIRSFVSVAIACAAILFVWAFIFLGWRWWWGKGGWRGQQGTAVRTSALVNALQDEGQSPQGPRPTSTATFAASTHSAHARSHSASFFAPPMSQAFPRDSQHSLATLMDPPGAPLSPSMPPFILGRGAKRGDAQTPANHGPPNPATVVPSDLLDMLIGWFVRVFLLAVFPLFAQAFLIFTISGSIQTSSYALGVIAVFIGVCGLGLLSWRVLTTRPVIALLSEPSRLLRYGTTYSQYRPERLKVSAVSVLLVRGAVYGLVLGCAQGRGLLQSILLLVAEALLFIGVSLVLRPHTALTTALLRGLLGIARIFMLIICVIIGHSDPGDPSIVILAQILSWFALSVFLLLLVMVIVQLVLLLLEWWSIHQDTFHPLPYPSSILWRPDLPVPHANPAPWVPSPTRHSPSVRPTTASTPTTLTSRHDSPVFSPPSPASWASGPHGRRGSDGAPGQMDWMNSPLHEGSQGHARVPSYPSGRYDTADPMSSRRHSTLPRPSRDPSHPGEITPFGSEEVIEGRQGTILASPSAQDHRPYSHPHAVDHASHHPVRGEAHPPLSPPPRRVPGIFRKPPSPFAGHHDV
ncbi:hypothetical protein BJ684DRAFT_17226, partial [Piptocephalis cylindrospora]